LARRFRRSTTDSGAGAGADAAAGGGAVEDDDEGDGSIVTVTDPVEEDCSGARVAMEMENLGFSSSSSSVAGAARRGVGLGHSRKATSSGQIAARLGNGRMRYGTERGVGIGEEAAGIYDGLSGFFFPQKPTKHAVA